MNMKHLALLGVLALVVISCVLVAGCTSATTTQQTTLPDSQPYSSGEVTDYSDRSNWMFYDLTQENDADLFFVYPTVALTSPYENGTAEITDDMKTGAIGTYVEMGSALGGYTNVYAPYYRQLAMDYVLQKSTYEECIELVRNSEGMKDVYAALDFYFAHANNGRPFILAGHSQGAAVVEIILDDYMKKHPEYYENMIAAYVIGCSITQDWLNANPHLKFAQGETDTGVIISWNTEGPGATGTNIMVGENTVLINPLTWTTDETYADTSLNKGSLTENELGIYYLLPRQHDAQIDAERGVLVCTTEPAELYVPYEQFGDKSLHTEDYPAYYANIRENGLKRIQAFLEKQN